MVSLNSHFYIEKSKSSGVQSSVNVFNLSESMKETAGVYTQKANGVQTAAFSWVVWGLAAAFYFADYLARVAPTVMHRDLQIHFGINEAQFGILTASFYLPYVLMQIPVGLTVDRMSIRGLLTVMSLVTAFGCVVFGLADGLVMASVGRMLIGFSAAFAFVSALRLATSWFPPAMLGLLAGLTQSLGMLGASAGQAPLSFLVSLTGWRHSLLIVAFLFIALAGLLYQFVRDKPGQNPLRVKKQISMPIIESLRIILSNRQTWINALYAGFLFAPTAVIGESNGPAYLQYGRGLSAHAAAFATGLIFIGWGISGPLSGWLSDRLGRRRPVMIGSAMCGMVLTSIFVFYPGLNEMTLYILFFLYGLTNTGVAIAYAVSTEIQSSKVIGTCIAFTNMISILIGALMQPLVGYFIDLAAGSRAYHVDLLGLGDFQAGLKLLPLCSMIAFFLAIAVKETYCRPQSKE